MTDILEDLRAKAKQSTAPFPKVLVTGDLLTRAADEIERLRALTGHEAILFEQRAAQVRQGVG